MRLNRAFVDAPLAVGTEIELPPGPAAHLTRVLRLHAGDVLVLFDGRGGEYDAQISAITRHGVRAHVGEHRAVERESLLQVTLLQAVARGERMDLVIQKATELGVASIVPVICDHGVVQLDAHGGERRIAHWQAVAISACEQCGRNRPPRIAPIASLEAACSAAPGVRLMLDPESEVPLTEAVCGAALGTESAVSLLIGPEGGFSAAERATARRTGFQPCQLGPRILRTETAALAAVAAVQVLAGDLRLPG
jgi:16S rRNA (uracil1498-N3)-methyltransferase